MSIQQDLDLIRAEIKRVAEDDSIDEINAQAILDKKAKEIGFESWQRLEPVYDQYAAAGFKVDEKNMFSSIMSGLTFGWADEIEAAAVATVGSLFGDSEWLDVYDKRVAQERAGQEAFRQLKPGQDIAGEVIGGAIPTAAALLLTPFTGGTSIAGLSAAQAARQGARIGARQIAAKGARVGATTGAVAGAGYGEGVEGKALGAGLGLGLGAGLGATLPAAGAAIGRGVGMIRKTPVEGFSKDEQKALKQISTAFAKDEITPEEVIKQIQTNIDADKIIGMSPVEVLADFGGEAVVRKLRATQTIEPGLQTSKRLLERTSGTAEQRAKAILTGKEPDIQSTRILNAIEQASGSIRTKGINLKSGIDDISDAMQAKVTPLYENAFNNPLNKKINNLQIYNYIKDNPEILTTYKRARRNYQIQAQSNNRVSERIPGTFNDVIKTDEKGNIVEILNPLPLEMLDQMKRVADNKIFSNVKLKGLAKQEADLKKTVVHNFRNSLKKISDGDDYENALSAASDKLALNEAFENGIKMTKQASTSENYLKAMKKLETPAEKDAFRIGVFQELQKSIVEAKDNIDLVKRIMDSPSLRAKITALFEGEEQAAKAFVDRLKREAKIQLTAAKVTRQSETADKLQDVVNLEKLLTDVAISGTGSETTQRAGLETAQILGRKLFTPKARDVGEILLTTDPKRQREILEAMKQLRTTSSQQITSGQNIGALRGAGITAAAIPGLMSD
mgnify:CR=1 FL=1